VLARRWRHRVVAAMLTDRYVLRCLQRLLRADSRARGKLEGSGVDVYRGGGRIEYSGCAQPEDRKSDRPNDEPADEELIAKTTGSPPLLLLALPLPLLFLAPLAAQLGGHT
jgi:hypothetical protein